MNLQSTATEAQKKALRKTKTVPDSVKAAIYSGNKAGPEMAIQFHKDVQLYDLWEALLYVESYEKEMHYRSGTAMTAFQAALLPDEEDEEAADRYDGRDERKQMGISF